MFLNNSKKEQEIVLNLLNEFERYLKVEINDFDVYEKPVTKNLSLVEEKILSIINFIKEKRVMDIQVYGEIMMVCEKLSDGFTEDTISKKSTDPKINYIIETINNMCSKMNDSFCEVESVLKDFEEQNYVKNVNEDLFRGGELLDVLQGLNSLRDTITKNLTQNYRQGLILEIESRNIVKEVEHLSVSSRNQAQIVEETAASIEEITSNISHNKQIAMEMSKLGKEVQASSQNGIVLVNQTYKSMDEISLATNKVFEAISVISQIAFQTNILSLNAAVEAATAGEAGKGFAVVAQEVRNLATKSAETAKIIESLMLELTNKSNEGKNTSQELQNEYTKLNSTILNTIEMINSVTTASREQEIGIKEIHKAIDEIESMTTKNMQIAQYVKEIAIKNEESALSVIESIEKAEFVGKEEIRKEF